MELSATVLNAVCAEMYRATIKHRMFPGNANPVRSAAILAEEAGEALKAALDLTRPTDRNTEQRRLEKLLELSNMREEVIQTAAVALLWLEQMEQERGATNEPGY